MKKGTTSSKKPADENTSIYAEYFTAVDKYCGEFGPETIIMMQVGSFFEVYGLQGYNGSKGKPGFYSNIDDFCRICDAKMADKKNTHQGYQILMAGTPEYTLENSVQRLISEQKTVVVFVQEDDMTKTKGKKRVFHSVYSPGTFLPLEDSQQVDSGGGGGKGCGSNHIMAIWIRSFKSLKDGEKYLCSFSCVNILSGHSYLYEYSCPKILSPTSFDDLERAISSFSPNELLFIKDTNHEAEGTDDDEEANRILQYIGINTSFRGGTTVHRINSFGHEKIQRLDRPVYVRETLAFFFGGATGIQSITEFHQYEFATKNLCFLLDWIHGHNPNLIKYISVPIFSNSSSRMILANHTLKQLNIISQGPNRAGSLSSVVQHLNKTGCSLGSRLFQYQIQNPTFDETWLNQEYEITDWFINAIPNTTLQTIRKNVGSIRDIERIGRQLVLGKVWPSAIYWLYQGIQKYTESIQLLDEFNVKTAVPKNNLLDTAFDPRHREENSGFLQFIQSRVQLEVCNEIKSLNTNTPFFQRGLSKELDKLQEQMNQSRQLLQSICSSLNAICSGGRPGIEEVEHVKIHETQKSGCYLHITQTRGAVLKDLLKKGAQQGSCLELAGGVQVLYKDIRITSGRGEKENIEFPLLVQTCNNLLKWEEQMSKIIENLYRDFLREIQGSWMNFLNERFRLIALLDVATTKAFLAMEYHYCRPELVPFQQEEGEEENDETSFFEARDLRHVLIEHLQKNELFVANDLSLGQDGQRGILLYGTNAVGKTSLIKSVGIAVIMAQAGIYVPCSHFRYRPYRSIYSRILGNDDLFRGLSTFVVEMSELRVILRMADEKSLVLGDELCSGTETESALSIFTAGLQHLYKKRVGFLFATHFHEIVSYSEIEEMSDQIRLKHLKVMYDRERGVLVYNRKLQEGSGNGTYGLEVAYSLSMPTDFLEEAYKIRQKYFSVGQEAGLAPLSFKPSRYNAEKIRGFCEVCKKKMGDEVHHIQPQQQADERGFIGHHHKNHPANLLNVCFECHDKIHNQQVVESESETKKWKKTFKAFALPEI